MLGAYYLRHGKRRQKKQIEEQVVRKWKDLCFMRNTNKN